jgi:DHA1 family tetracycline resistance protein-like MFS transporter
MNELTDQSNVKVGAARREAAFVFIFATIFLDMLAMGIVIPVLPKLVVDFVGGDTQEAARVFGVFGTAWALMQFLFSPLQGTLSDSFGRRTVILLSNFGVGLDYVLMALAPTLGWLLAGRVISGIAAASISTGYAYVADVTPPEQRAARFGLLGAAFGAGFVLGPALGGLAGNISPRLPFWIAAGLSLANACYGLLILPESLPRSQRARFRWRRANPFGALTLLRSHTELFGLAVVNFLGNLAHAVLPSIGVLYMLYRYGWDERIVGLTLAAVGVASIIVQGAVVGPVTKRVGERAALMIGLAFGVVGFSRSHWGVPALNSGSGCRFYRKCLIMAGYVCHWHRNGTGTCLAGTAYGWGSARPGITHWRRSLWLTAGQVRTILETRSTVS